jgi:hypothetical protein
MIIVDEMRLLADAAENVSAPTEPFRFYGDPLFDDDEENRRVLQWIVTEFFQNSPSHRLFFEIGLQGGLVFDERKQGLWAGPIPPDWTRVIESDLRSATSLVLSLYKQLESEDALWGDLPVYFNHLRQLLGLRKKFSVSRVAKIDVSELLAAWDACLQASDLVLHAVFHRHAPVARTTIDWAWLKQGVTEMRQRGEYDGGVILLPNGQVVTGRVLPKGFNLNLLMDAPDQVPFLDRSHGFGLMRIVTWAELESGAVFKGKDCREID